MPIRHERNLWKNFRPIGMAPGIWWRGGAVKYEIIYGFIGILIALIYFVGALLLCARGIRRAALHTREVRRGC